MPNISFQYFTLGIVAPTNGTLIDEYLSAVFVEVITIRVRTFEKTGYSVALTGNVWLNLEIYV